MNVGKHSGIFRAMMSVNIIQAYTKPPIIHITVEQFRYSRVPGEIDKTR